MCREIHVLPRLGALRVVLRLQSLEALIHLLEAVAHVARQPVDRLLQISDVIGSHIV